MRGVVSVTVTGVVGAQGGDWFPDSDHLIYIIRDITRVSEE